MRLYAAIVTEESDLPETVALKGLGKALKQLERLEAMVGDAWRAIQSEYQREPSPDGFQAVFLAPEYYFSNQRHSDDRFFSRDVKRAIITGLSALARAYPKLLIVPGTVLSTKPLYDTAFQIGRGGGSTPHLNQARLGKAVARIQAASTFGTQTNAKDWSHTRDVATTGRMLAQNVAYLCLGTQVLKYHKVGNYMEVKDEARDLMFVPGSLVGRFAVGGVKYALEICMDHALGVFDSTVASDGKVDIQLIVSSFVDCKTNPNASVTLHSSTMSAQAYYDASRGAGATTGTNPVRFGGDGLAKLADTPIKKPAFTVWVIDIKRPGLDRASVTDYTLKDTSLPPVSHIH